MCIDALVHVFMDAKPQERKKSYNGSIMGFEYQEKKKSTLNIERRPIVSVNKYHPRPDTRGMKSKKNDKKNIYSYHLEPPEV